MRGRRSDPIAVASCRPDWRALVVVRWHDGQNAMVPIVPVQCWLAREALRWRVARLARASGLSPATVRRFEGGGALKASTVEVIQRTLEAAGVIFIGADDGGPSARLRGSGETAPKVPTLTSHEYHVVVTLRGPSWEWEIYRDGVPLPVPLWDGFHTSKSAAEVAGRIALREFLEALDREQKTSD